MKAGQKKVEYKKRAIAQEMNVEKQRNKKLRIRQKGDLSSAQFPH